MFRSGETSSASKKGTPCRVFSQGVCLLPWYLDLD